jgi:hypothetical protein
MGKKIALSTIIYFLNILYFYNSTENLLFIISKIANIKVGIFKKILKMEKFEKFENIVLLHLLMFYTS